MVRTPAHQRLRQDEEIKELIQKFSCTAPAECDAIRTILMRIGTPAVPALVEVFKTRELDEKIQAAKTLAAIGEKQSLIMLIESLRNDDFEIRYAAIQGLPSAGEKAVIPIMRGIIDYGNETYFRAGVHAVLHRIAEQGYVRLLKPMLAALEGPQPEYTTPLTAYEVLKKVGQG